MEFLHVFCTMLLQLVPQKASHSLQEENEKRYRQPPGSMLLPMLIDVCEGSAPKLDGHLPINASWVSR